VPDLDPLVKRLHARHPDYTGTRGEGLWRLLSDAAEGSGGFRAAIDTLLTLAAEDDLEEPRFQDVPRSYVVRYPRERLAAYARRVRTATYANYVAPVLREYAGHLWRKPPQRSDLPVAVAQVWADVDGAGTGIDDWMRLGSRRAQLYGWAVAFVDRPAGDLTPAEARTTAQWLQPDELVDWALGDDGDFAWARLCTETCERDPWAEGEVEREVYTTWTRETWRRVVVEEVKVDNVKVERVVEDTGEVPHSLGCVPLVRLYWQRPEDPERIYGTSQVDGLASLALEHFNLKAELREWERGQNFGILCVQSQDADVLQRIKVGVHGGIRVEPGMGMPEFVAPPAEIGAHSFVTGMSVQISGVSGMTQINGLRALITGTDATHITVAIDSSAFSTYTSGGVVHTRPQVGESVTAGYEFDYPVRFNSTLPVGQDYPGFRPVDGVELIELLNP
jgi:hypothetical protein